MPEIRLAVLVGMRTVNENYLEIKRNNPEGAVSDIVAEQPQVIYKMDQSTVTATRQLIPRGGFDAGILQNF